MIKPLLLVLFIGLFFSTAQGQQKGVVYYVTNSGKLVSTKDSADYWMTVMPPDTAVNKNLYVVYEYNKNGKVRLMTSSYTKDLNLKYQGRYIAYFPNGRRKAIGTYEGGEMKGRQMVYYPNGKLYSITNYPRPGLPYYSECRDSTGGVLTQNGNGLWKQFDDDFTYVLAEGKIENGLQEGEWKFKKSATESFTVNYKHGQEVQNGQTAKDSTFKPIEVVPSFPGGIEAFYKFIMKNLRYPDVAYRNNTFGKVIVSFVVERDGSITDVKVSRGIGDGCDEEAVRVIKLSPPWSPGMQGGKPVRVAYSVPIMFGNSK